MIGGDMGNQTHGLGIIIYIYIGLLNGFDVSIQSKLESLT